MALAPATRREITALRDRYPHPRSAILPSLWAVQNEVGHLTGEGMAEVAEILDLAPSEVQAVSTFYSMYFDKPAGEHHVLICVNVSCALRGADDIVSHVEKRLQCPSGGTTADKKFTWESTVECLGACGGAPAMQVDHHFFENLTEERVDTILERVRTQPAAHAHSESAPASGPHPPAAETPPLATAEGPPSSSRAAGGEGTAAGDPPVERTEKPASGGTPSANPPGSRSAPRTRARPRSDDL